MRLEIGTFPVNRVRFADSTRWHDGLLEINREELEQEVRSDPRVAKASIELAAPGESTRIWPVRDVIEPRIKVEGLGVVYPAICDRPVMAVGEGKTNRLSGVCVVEVSEVPWHAAGHDHVMTFLDMSGPWGEMIPYSSLYNVCVVVEPVPGLNVDIKNRVVHNACLKVSDALAATTKGLQPPSQEVFELPPGDPALPKVAYIMCIHSSEATSGLPSTFCTSIYGWTQLSPPWALHPNEILDGAVNGPYRTVFATSWMQVNNPVLLELYKRHGTDLNFVGCVTMRTEWTTQREKDLIAEQTARLAKLLGSDGVLVTWDAGGNEEVEVVQVIKECEKLGIDAVWLTSDDDIPSHGVSTVLTPSLELEAIVSTGCFRTLDTGLKEVPPVDRVIGSVEKAIGRLRDTVVPTSGPLPPPGMFDDHYGYTRQTCVEY